jgi:transcriptional regulator with XRE-family HTH domain
MPRPQRDPDPDSLIGHFGAELRTYRNKADLSMAQLAAALGCSAQWIGQVELADKPPSRPFAIDLDTYFKTDGSFYRLWKAIKRAGHGRSLLPGFPRFVELEERAVFIRCFAGQVVPGLLQTEPYARAVMNPDELPATLEERVSGRLERQRILAREKPPKILFVLDESVLHRPIGGPEVMRDQLAKLAGFNESPQIQIRILSYSSVTYAGLDGSFLMLSFARDPEVLYVEGPGFAQLIEDREAVRECEVRFDLVLGEALPRAESSKKILRAREDFT